MLVITALVSCKKESEKTTDLAPAIDSVSVPKTPEVKPISSALKILTPEETTKFLQTKNDTLYVTNFFATWCGPCMQGIKEIASLKEEMKNENVVFLYITGPSSPEKTWNNNIPNIKGKHYRVTQDEWNYLTQKFNISGIPHYVLVNKNGEVVNPKLGHHGNEALKRILVEQMK